MFCFFSFDQTNLILFFNKQPRILNSVLGKMGDGQVLLAPLHCHLCQFVIQITLRDALLMLLILPLPIPFPP